MSFWDLANGRPSDLSPLKAPSTATALAPHLGGMVAGSGLAVGGAFALFCLAPPLWPAALSIIRGVQYASRSAGSIPDTLTELEAAREKVASARVAQAIRYYERALKIDPHNPTILSRLARAYASRGKFKDATAAIERALSLSPENLSFWLDKGTIQLAASDLSGARTSFEKASVLQPDNSEVWSSLGLVCELMGDRAAAQHCWEEATRAAPDNASAWINRGELAYLLGDVQEGVASWRRACELEPSISPKWVVEYEKGTVAFSKGDIKSAAAHYDAAIKLNPDYAPPWIGKALCAKQVGRMNVGVRERHDHDVRLFPDLTDTTPFLKDGLNFLDKAIQLDRHNVTAWFNRGNFLWELQRPEEATKAWEEAFSIDPAVRVPWVISFDEGTRLLAVGQAHAAVPHFHMATTLYPEYAEAWFKKGVAHRALGQNQDARHCWARCLEIQSGHSVSLLNLGTLEFEAGNRDAASELWERALAANHSLSQAAMNKGAALADAGRLQEAIAYFSKAAAVGHPLAQDALGLARAYEHMDPSVGPRP